MAYFPWEEKYSVGIQKIDAEHKALVGFLNALYEAMQAGKGRDIMKDIFIKLVDYTDRHFATEESLMKLHGFTGYAEHKEKHDKMRARVVRLKAEIEAGEIQSPLQVTNFLKEWIAKHIMGTDMAYAPYLRGKGVK